VNIIKKGREVVIPLFPMKQADQLPLFLYLGTSSQLFCIFRSCYY